jgi:ABC-type branched-subunit amino acid transport system ATPase component
MIVYAKSPVAVLVATPIQCPSGLDLLIVCLYSQVVRQMSARVTHLRRGHNIAEGDVSGVRTKHEIGT